LGALSNIRPGGKGRLIHMLPVSFCFRLHKLSVHRRRANIDELGSESRRPRKSRIRRRIATDLLERYGVPLSENSREPWSYHLCRIQGVAWTEQEAIQRNQQRPVTPSTTWLKRDSATPHRNKLIEIGLWNIWQVEDGLSPMQRILWQNFWLTMP
jgi:hypothetical protein